MDGQATVVGRAQERDALRSALSRAASGAPVLVLVHGEPGIGKTWLVQEAASRAGAEGAHVLSGQCLRFGADVTSYLPFTQALGRWLRSAEGDLPEGWNPRGGVEGLVPSLVSPSRDRAPVEISRVLDVLQADRPTVLVVDDLQWADPSSLDVLTYVMAGFTSRQRLAVLTTFRDTDLGEGHRLHGWLADADRMAGVTRLELGRMDLWGIEEMLVARGDDPRGAAEILSRSGGNPYLADLLLRHMSHASSKQAPSHLGEALLASWHRLSSDGRRVTQMLALSGSPTAVSVLCALGTRFGLSTERTSSALREASAEGITVRTDSGSVWFRHPLLAETIAGTLDAWEAAPIHADLAAAWDSAEGVDERDRANALALHHVAAGRADEGLHWSLRAADEAESIRSWVEAASHLSTALSLLQGLPEGFVPKSEHIELLLRAARACESAGDDGGAVAHYETALSRVDRVADARLASRIILELHILRDIAGYGSTHLSMAEPREVLELTRRHPTVPERAQAFAQLAFAEVFNGTPGALEHAESAVRLAEAGDGPAANVWAVGARSQARWGTDEGVADAERALALAEESGDAQLICRSAIFLSNSLQSVGRYGDAAVTTERCYRLLLGAGQPDFAASVGAVCGWWHFVLGRWDTVRTLVRELLTIARGRNNAGAARCLAALVTAHGGAVHAAELHLARARELLPTAAPVGDTLAATEVLVAIATGRPMDALELIDRCMLEVVQIDPVAADEFLEYASRAAVAASGHGAPAHVRDEAIRLYRGIEVARGEHPTPFAPAGPFDHVHPAMGALHAAQRAHLFEQSDDLAALWEAACHATEAADLRYEHARALHGLARHLLTHRSDRRRAVAALAVARGIADDLGAAPLCEEIEGLARQSHISLSRKVDQEDEDPVAFAAALPASPPLTPREREVLACLLAGETYSQIGARLFISDKTVSTHVSNLLRKTGTSTRIELADLALRGSPAPES